MKIHLQKISLKLMIGFKFVSTAIVETMELFHKIIFLLIIMNRYVCFFVVYQKVSILKYKLHLQVSSSFSFVKKMNNKKSLHKSESICYYSKNGKSLYLVLLPNHGLDHF